ncbi:hypothetical protein GCM10027074_45840 [Streptomyces deserti]
MRVIVSPATDNEPPSNAVKQQDTSQQKPPVAAVESPSKDLRGDRRTPVAGGRDDGGPREGRGPGQGRACASVASMEVREPLRRSCDAVRRRLGRGAAPALPTPTNLPDAC